MWERAHPLTKIYSQQDRARFAVGVAMPETRLSAAHGVLKRTATSVFGLRGKPEAPKAEEDKGPQRRHLPAQAGSMDDRRDASALSRLESESKEAVIEAGLWRYHRLIPPHEDSVRYSRFKKLLEYFLYYTSFWLPVRVAFFSSLHSAPWMIVDGISYAIDITFWVDIGLTFRTAFYEQNELITDWKTIGSRYLEFWFWLDALANFPWDLVTGVYQARQRRHHRVPDGCPAASISGSSVSLQSAHLRARACVLHLPQMRIIRLFRALRLRKQQRGATGATGVVVRLMSVLVRTCHLTAWPPRPRHTYRTSRDSHVCVSARELSSSSSSFATGSRACGFGSERWTSTCSRPLGTAGSSAIERTPRAPGCQQRRSTARQPQPRSQPSQATSLQSATTLATTKCEC